MKQIELLLVPTPGSKPEFLAAILPKQTPPPSIWQSITNHNKSIILEGYTRDSWALSKSTKSWISLQVRSIDGRNKLPGFIQYLQQRQKLAFGRFIVGPGDGKLETYVWIISHNEQQSSSSSGTLISLTCRITAIVNLPNCPLRPKSSTITTNSAAATGGGTQSRPAKTAVAAAVNSASTKPNKKGFGLLGNLVGAQKRTNTQVVTSTTTTTNGPRSTSNGDNKDPSTKTTNNMTSSSSLSHDAQQSEELQTSGQILANFRNEMEQKMLDFDLSSETINIVPVKLSDHIHKVIESDKPKITLEILKYIVYEQVEEMNDEWIAYKEPSEFLDEVTIAVYKNSNDVPPEILEDLNKAEIPEEQKIQQRILQEQKRQQEIKTKKSQEQLQNIAMKNMATSNEGVDDDFAVLNTQKRDRRTIEDYQRENTKRQKGEE